ncbi:hypothetical protein [Marinobacter sp. BGYM27]|uniref:hypothetical protein n=1 Tax=Marinobacter sp. BGYM27 TaxID=2975597 RepID=UPI0021A474EF|nr:hypothetical protein [Marinobacter sp. BGYM27]MDG5501092.1 hypothetical protein [Marinobacter sp. BGYM27]
MDKRDAQIKILAQAVYELRLLLSDHLGSSNKEMLCETVSAHIAYALHNEALAIIEGRSEDFDVYKAIENIKRVDELYGQQIAGRFEAFLDETKT